LAFIEAINQCQRAHAWQHALSLRQVMLQEGYGHCLSGFHALIMAKTRWQSAVAVLEDMRICSIPPSSVSFSLIVGSCRVADEWRWPLAMLGLDPESLWGSVAGACQQAAQWRWSAWLLEKHGEDQLTESTFNLALSICKVPMASLTELGWKV